MRVFFTTREKNICCFFAMMIKKGIVYCSTGSHYRVKSDALFYDCRIKGKFRIQGIKSTNPVAVGDKVLFETEGEEERKTGVITDIEARQNYIIRKSVNLSKQTHIIASNIDNLVYGLFTFHKLMNCITTVIYIKPTSCIFPSIKDYFSFFAPFYKLWKKMIYLIGLYKQIKDLTYRYKKHFFQIKVWLLK